PGRSTWTCTPPPPSARSPRRRSSGRGGPAARTAARRPRGASAMAGKPAGAGVTASVEAPLWQALTGYRVLTGAYALALFALAYDDYGRPLVGAAYLGVLAA